jgi:hypothetical protein
MNYKQTQIRAEKEDGEKEEEEENLESVPQII